MSRFVSRLLLLTICAVGLPASASEPVRIATFDVDASPRIGGPLAYDPTVAIESPLRCRGVVLLGNSKPVVLCAVDWLGIGNESNLLFRDRIAKAVGTTRDHVAVHTLHQHDAPRSDLSAERILIHSGVTDPPYDPALTRAVAGRAARAAAEAVKHARIVTHVGLGQGTVEKVASNRRILGPDGKVKYTRWTACTDPKIRAEPVGTIDPPLKLIAFYNGDQCLVALTFYATHPQSYYRTGKANPDFPGLARATREDATGVLHVHFNGAGGNIGAGKWNDGSQVNRQILADPKASRAAKISASSRLVWAQRSAQGDKVDIGCLRLGAARVLFMPGELFIEYQLAAQKMRPHDFVAMAAYGEYGPAYIGTEIAYRQGGYETSPRSSYVAPEVESVLMRAMKELLARE